MDPIKKTKDAIQKSKLAREYKEYFNKHSGWDQFFFWSFVVVGLFNLYVWLVALVSLCAGVQLTTWLLPVNVFYYVLAGGAAYLLLFLLALIYRFCVVGILGLGTSRANRWMGNAFFGLLIYVVFFVLTLTFANFYELFDSTFAVNRGVNPTSESFITIVAPYNANVASNINSNFALAGIDAVGEALSNWFANLVVILVGTTLEFVVTLMIVFSPWNDANAVLGYILNNQKP